MNIFRAANLGDLKTVKTLINIGVDVNKEDIDGETPIYLASKNRHLEVVKVLKSVGAQL